MPDKVKGYPDIEFVDTDTQKLVNAIIQSYELFTGRTLYPADPVRLFILWVADIIVQERVLIDFSAKQNLPRYAEGEYLDSLAELFKDVYRLEPVKARTTLRFTLSISLDSSVMIPAGTRVTVDGEIVFATIENLTIPAGQTNGIVIADCLTLGETGNGFVPGQINKLVDIFPYFGSVENITQSAGGADEEADEAFYKRMRESVETYSTAGPMGAYEYYAKTASPLISDAKAVGPREEPGVVDIRVLLKNGQMPTEEIFTKVLETVTAERTRPLTDLVRVAAPGAVSFDIDITYYVPKPSAASAEKIKQDAEAAVEEYVRWQTEKMGRDVDPSELIYRIKKTGVKRVEVRKPEFQAVERNEVANLASKTVENGGIEDE